MMDPQGFIDVKVGDETLRGRITFGSVRRIETSTGKSVFELARLLDNRRLSIVDAVRVVAAVVGEVSEEYDEEKVGEMFTKAGFAGVFQPVADVLSAVFLGLSGDVEGAAGEGKGS